MERHEDPWMGNISEAWWSLRALQLGSPWPLKRLAGSVRPGPGPPRGPEERDIHKPITVELRAQHKLH